MHEKINGHFEQEKSEPILSEQDREVIEIGLHRLKDLIEKSRPEDLPAVIVFLETSARPLVYAVKPILEKIYRDAHVSMPSYRFLTTITAYSRTHESRDDEPDAKNEEAEWLRREIKNLISEFGKLISTAFHYDYMDEAEGKRIREAILQRGREYRAATGWTKSQSERLKAIQKNSRQGGILFVDDYISINADTLKQILDLEHLVPNDKKISFFTLFSAIDKEELARLTGSHRMTCEAGLTYDEVDKQKNWRLRSYDGLRRSYIGENEEVKSKEVVLGVKKDVPSQTTVRSELANPQQMRQIREEMASIGEKVLSDENFNRDERLKN